MAEITAEARESISTSTPHNVVQGETEVEQMEMEVGPGIFLPFRGAKETWAAVAHHKTLESTCLDCTTQLVSVVDCEHVVCPDCNMINPIFDHPPNTTGIFGVGMGFKKEWIEQEQQGAER